MNATLSLREIEEFDPHAAGRDAGASGERRFLCPLCGQGKARDAAHRSLAANTQTGAWLCHRCGEKGKLREWWSDDEQPRLDKKARVRRQLRQSFSLGAFAPASGENSSAPSITPSVTPPFFAAVPEVSSVNEAEYRLVAKKPVEWRKSLGNLIPLNGTSGESYLLSRGLPVDLCHQSGVRFSPSWFGQPAAVFAIRDDKGNLVAAQGRYVRESRGPKARTAGDKKAGVFATANLWEEVGKGAPVVVCEAPIDALSIALCGYPALALCGKDGWPSWLAIRCAFKRVALAFDADEAGDAGAAKLHQALASLGAQPFRLRPEGGKDWNQLLIEQGRSNLADWLAERILTT